MKKQLTLSLFVLLFLLSSNSSFASFPVKKVVSETISNTSTTVDTQNNEETYAVVAGSKSGKSQWVALGICWFVGIIGIHRFYLGYTWQGVVQLLTAGVLGIWTLIDLVRIFTGDLQPKNGKYSKTIDI